MFSLPVPTMFAKSFRETLIIISPPIGAPSLNFSRNTISVIANLSFTERWATMDILFINTANSWLNVLSSLRGSTVDFSRVLIKSSLGIKPITHSSKVAAESG